MIERAARRGNASRTLAAKCGRAEVVRAGRRRAIPYAVQRTLYGARRLPFLVRRYLDAALAHAGPWLIDTEQVGAELIDALVAMEQVSPAVTWLFAVQTLDGLAQLLQLNLDIELPDGRTALLRFWDPRVLVNLAEVLEPTQRETFFAHIHEWHLLHKGKRVWIGRPHAQA